MRRLWKAVFWCVALVVFLSVGLSLPVDAAPPSCATEPSCTVPLPACGGVCAYDSATDTWECDLDDGSGSTSGEGVVVANFYKAGTTYCSTAVDYAAWGTTRSGTNFFCSFDSNAGAPVSTVVLLGTQNDDDLCFAAPNWILENADPANVSHLQGNMSALGNANIDELLGSPADAADYDERLDGGSGNDDIYGQEGDDVLIGGSGADILHGEEGDDSMSGGADNDQVFGNDGFDVLCGQTGADTLGGGNDDDILDAGGNVGDARDGGAGTDECDAAGISCTNPITSSYTCPS